MSDPYTTVEEADVYFTSHPEGAAWQSASAAVKLKMLGMASDAIDRQHLKGSKLSSGQARAFPRLMTFVSQSSIPQRVLDATCEEANALLQQLNTPRLSLQRQGVSSVSFDGSSETFNKGAGTRLLSVVARELLIYDLLGPV